MKYSDFEEYLEAYKKEMNLVLVDASELLKDLKEMYEFYNTHTTERDSAWKEYNEIFAFLYGKYEKYKQKYGVSE